MKSRKLLIGCGVILALGLGIAFVGILAGYLIPKRSSGTFSALVNVNLPLNGAKLPLNEPVSIYAEAISDHPVHDLELWLDGAFSPTKMDSSPADKSPLNATWLWTPTAEGSHRLIVRAIGSDGEVSNSNVVTVSVLPRDQIPDLQATDIPIGLQPPVEAPTGTEAVPPEGLTATPPPPPFPPEDQPQDPAPPPVGAPSLQGTINQCDAALLIQDNAENEEGFYLYRLDPTSTGFVQVAKLDENPDTGIFNYLDPGLSLGDYTYYISSFDNNSESVSNLISLEVTDPQCAAASPQAIGLQDATLTTTKAVDKVYCYLSVDQGPWSRIPPGSQEFIYPTNGEFDLGDYLNTLISPPPPGGVTLELECWGWSGNTLVYLGYIKQEVDEGAIQIGVDPQLIGVLSQSAIQNIIAILSSKIAPPHSVKFAQDVNECVAHTVGVYPHMFATMLCGFTNFGYSALTWQWTSGCGGGCGGQDPNCPYNVDEIDGYRVYRVDSGMEPILIDTVTNPTLTMALVPPHAGITQYYVRAYKGVLESEDSNHVNDISPQSSVTLTNPKMFDEWVTKNKQEGLFTCAGEWGPYYYEFPQQNNFWVGYSYRKDIAANGCTSWHSNYHDGKVIFDDLSPIQGEVTGATLRWNWNNSVKAGLGTQAPGCWVSLKDQFGGVIANYPLMGSNGYDVTNQVRAWTHGLSNNGFTLFSNERQLTYAENEVCLLRFGNFELEVSYTQ